MTIHLSASGKRIIGSIGIELGKKLLNGSDATGKHPCLIPVVPGAPVSFLKGTRQGDLGNFLTITENAEFSFTA